MSEAEMPSMTKVPPCTRSFPRALLRGLHAAVVGLLLASGLVRPASAQTPGRITVAGTVTSPEGSPVPGVTVSVQGSDARAECGSRPVPAAV